MIDVCICNTSNLQIEPCTTKWKQLEMEAARNGSSSNDDHRIFTEIEHEGEMGISLFPRSTLR
jgi:hypothetical protein